MLNTATAVDIRFDDRQRRIILRNGEIMVTTARDTQDRPFVVATQFHGACLDDAAGRSLQPSREED